MVPDSICSTKRPNPGYNPQYLFRPMRKSMIRTWLAFGIECRQFHWSSLVPPTSGIHNEAPSRPSGDISSSMLSDDTLVWDILATTMPRITDFADQKAIICSGENHRSFGANGTTAMPCHVQRAGVQSILVIHGHILSGSASRNHRPQSQIIRFTRLVGVRMVRQQCHVMFKGLVCEAYW